MRSGRWRGFLPQLFVFTILPLTLLLVVIAFGSLGVHQQAMRHLVGERDERATRAAAAAITEQLNHRGAAVRSLAHLATAIHDPEHALADAAFLAPDFDGGLALFASGGRLLGSTDDITFWQSPILLQHLVTPGQEMSTPGQVHFSPHFPHPTTGETTMLVFYVTPEDITAVGAFSPLPLARWALIDVFDPGEQAAAFVVDAAGESIYQAGHLSLSLPEGDLSRYPGVAEALRGESGAAYHTADGDEYVVAYSPIPQVNWALVIEEPWRAVTNPLLRATELAPFTLVPALLIALVGLWFGLRQIVQPLQTLAQKATALAWGDFTAIEEPVGGIHEIQRLQTELVHMAQKVKLAQQSLRGYLGAVTAGQEEERRRLARDLHDDTLQSLIGLNQRLQLAQMVAKPEQKDTVAAQGAISDHLAEMQQMTAQIIADLRRLTRDLRPIYLEDLGLVPALDMLARDTGQLLDIPVTFQKAGSEQRLSPEVELALYRIAQEGLSNVIRHAQARCVTLSLEFGQRAIMLIVVDDGLGFVMPDSPAELASAGHFGLLGVQERAEAIGARLSMDSRPGEGTRLAITL